MASLEEQASVQSIFHDLTPVDQEYREIFGPITKEIYLNYQNFFATDTSFFILAPTNMLTYYYRIVMRNLWWFRGYVPFIHNNGIFAQNLGNWICKKIAELTMSGDYRLEGFDTGVSFLDKFNKDRKIKKKLSKVLPMLNAVGFALAKVDCDLSGKMDINFVKGNRYFAQTDSNMNLIAFKAYIMFVSSEVRSNKRDMTTHNLSDQGELGYYVIQERWMEGNNVYQRYRVFKGPSYINNAVFPEPTYIQGEQLDEKTKKQIKTTIGYDLDKIYQLPFNGRIGASILYNSLESTGVEDFTCFSDSTLFGIHTKLYDYDLTYTQKMFDKYLAQKGVLVPDSLNPPTTDYVQANQRDQLSSRIIKKIPYMDLDDQKPFFYESTLRMEEYNKDLRAILNNIAAEIGLTPTTLAGFLDNNQAERTATEVDSEETATRVTIETKRKLITDALRELYVIVLNHYQIVDEFGLVGDIDVVFNQEVIANPSKETDLTVQQKNAGLISEETAIRRTNKHMNKKEIDEEMKKIDSDRQKRQSEEVW